MACSAALAGCDSAARDSAEVGDLPAGGAGGEANVPDALRFEPVPRSVKARQQVELRVVATPASGYAVRFSLPSDEIAPRDAVLNRTSATTGEDGAATVVLTAPTSPGRVIVRAHVERVRAEVELDVIGAETGSVRVKPLNAGRRQPKSWVASAHAGITCAELSGTPPPDGEWLARSAVDTAPELMGLPFDTSLAITLRSAFYAGGCTSLERLSPALPGETPVVQVTVLDRPLDLEHSPLTLSLLPQPPDAGFRGLLADAAARIDAALLGSSDDDADALLDAMRAQLFGAERDALDAARSGELWDALVRESWDGSQRLRGSVQSWLGAGKQVLSGGETALSGELRPIDAGSAELWLSAFAGIDAGQAGFVRPALVSWSAEADDRVVMSAQLFISSSRLATALALPAALEQFPDATSGESALALALGCGELGAALASAGADSVEAYAGCGAECMAALCERAAQALWQRARDATSLSPVAFGLTGSALVKNVGDEAQIAGMEGTWLGQLSLGDRILDTGGSFTGVAPVSDP